MEDSSKRAEVNCQKCQRSVTLTDIDKLAQHPRRQSESTSRAATAQSAQHSPLSGSYVDVRSSAALPGMRAGRGDSFQNLTKVFELAATQTHLDHPLCAKCLDNVAKELQERAAAAEQLAQAYEETLATLQEERAALDDTAHDDSTLTELHSTAMTEAQLHTRLAQAEVEEKVELERSRRLDAELRQVEAELAEVHLEEEAVAEEEADAWQRFNALWLDLQDGVEELDAVTTKTDVAARHLDALRQTSVLEDCFHIWFQDRFGTISGFRLGRMREEVPWAEVNAAWGQAVLLLDMMMRMYPSFQWQHGVLKPMSSYSEISDGKTDYKLYGPASTLWSGPFDKAMMLYLSCLDCFAKFVKEKAAREHKPLLPMFNTIDADRGTVAGYSIRYSGMTGNPDVWNKALKCLLVNLKVLLAWVTNDKGCVDAGSTSVPPQMSVGDARGRGRGIAQSLTQSMRASMFPARGGGDQRSAGQFGGQSMFQM